MGRPWDVIFFDGIEIERLLSSLRKGVELSDQLVVHFACLKVFKWMRGNALSKK